MNKLFGTAGIRGIVGKELTSQMVHKLGEAIVEWWKDQQSPIILSTDARESADYLKSQLLEQIIEGGIMVYDFGRLSFPEVAWTSRTYGTLAIYITASHNPPEYNGFKFLFKGRELTREEEIQLEDIYTRISSNNKNEGRARLGKVIRENAECIHHQYLRALKEWIETEIHELVAQSTKRPLRIIVDAANGMTSSLTPLLLSQLGHQVISINSHESGAFPGRPAEPKDENLGILKSLCTHFNAIGIAHDGDGDRVAIVTQEGKVVDLSRMLAFFAWLMSKKRMQETKKKQYVVTSVDTSLAIDQTLQEEGVIEVKRTKLGYLIDEILALPKGTVLFAGEPWKHIFPSWGMWMDGIAAAGLFVEYIAHSGGNIEHVFMSIANPPYLRKDLVVPNRDEAFTRACHFIEENYDVQAVNTADGQRYQLAEDRWVLVRKSGTEPKIRLYGGARSYFEIEQIIEAIMNVIVEPKNNNGEAD